MEEQLFINGNIYTMAREGSTAQAFAVRDGRLTAIGSNAEILARKGGEATDLGGRTVLPGLMDAHMHPDLYAESLGTVDLSGAGSLSELLALLRAKAASTPAGQWVRGVAFDHEKLAERRFPTAADLDGVSAVHPIFISRCCLHAHVANNMALGLAGVAEPSGLLLEGAVEPLYRAMDDGNPTDPEAARRTVLREFSSYGITGITALESDLLGGLALYRELAARGDLPVRVYVASDQLPPADLKTGDGDDRVRYGFLKLFCDGSLGAGTALLRAPYADEPDTRGLANHGQAELNEIVLRAHRAGLQVGIHAIGDGAVDMALQAIERAASAHPRPDPRFRLIHASLTDDGLLDRMARLPVVADVQPKFLSTDIRWIEDRIGPERSKDTFRWRTMLRRGIPLSGGSDLPVEPCNPFLGIAAAVTRQRLDGWPQGGWHRSERLTVFEAIALFTTGAAYASFAEGIRGTLEPGKLADFILLNADPFAVPPEQLATIGVEETWLGGAQVFCR